MFNWLIKKITVKQCEKCTQSAETARSALKAYSVMYQRYHNDHALWLRKNAHLRAEINKMKKAEVK